MISKIKIITSTWNGYIDAISLCRSLIEKDGQDFILCGFEAKKAEVL
jgi:hypothetical protein